VKIAVTGATGFIGRHLVDRLLAEEHQVTVIAHRRPSENLFAGEVNITTASVGDAAGLQASFEGAETVYHLVGIIVETKTSSFEKTVVEGTRNVVTACRGAGVKKLMYLSAMGTSSQARTLYHQTKYRAEQAVLSSQLDYVIFRPSVVYGLGDGFVSMLKRIVEKSYITPVVGDGRYRLQPVYIDDLVSALVQGLTVPQASGQIIEIGGPEKLEYLEILDTIKRVLGKTRMNLHIPMWVMKPMAVLMEKVLRPAPITVDQLKMMAMGNTGDISKMMEIFSINPTKFEDGLKKYLRWEDG